MHRARRPMPEATAVPYGEERDRSASDTVRAAACYAVDGVRRCTDG